MTTNSDSRSPPSPANSPQSGTPPQVASDSNATELVVPASSVPVVPDPADLAQLRKQLEYAMEALKWEREQRLALQSDCYYLAEEANRLSEENRRQADEAKVLLASSGAHRT
jgi:hypothetical protein